MHFIRQGNFEIGDTFAEVRIIASTLFCLYVLLLLNGVSFSYRAWKLTRFFAFIFGC